LENRRLLTVNLINSYTGMNQAAAVGPTNTPGSNWFYTPPDPAGAAGTTSYVETANQGIRLFPNKTTSTGALTRSLNDFWFTQGGLTALPAPTMPMTHPLDNLSDPMVVWDDQVNRFIVGDQDVGGNGQNRFEIAVSRSASPATLTAADWFFFQVNTTEANRSADYPGNFGYNRDAFVFTLNQNSTAAGTNSVAQVVSISINDLINGNPITPFINDFAPIMTTNSGVFTLRPTVMHDSVAGDPMWLLYSTDATSTTLNVVRMAVLSNTPGFTNTALPVNQYQAVVQPLQPNGNGLAPANGNGALWTHVLKAAEYNNTIVACDQISVSATEDDARWYSINVSSGTPTLVDEGNISAGNDKYVVFPSIDINARGEIGMTYLQSGGSNPANAMGAFNEFMSTYVTGRSASDAAGTMQTPVLVSAGVTNSTDGREGDMSGLNTDTTPLTVTPAADQKAVEGADQAFNLGSFTDFSGDFWAAGEFAATGGAWAEDVGQFTVGTKGPWSVTVDWGDGTANTTFNLAAIGSLGTQNHTFAEESAADHPGSNPYVVSVKVTDTATNESDTKTFNVTVSDPAVTPTGGFNFVAVEGQPSATQTVATFIDPGGAEVLADYSASINWGDGTTSAGTISGPDASGVFTVTGSHTYATGLGLPDDFGNTFCGGDPPSFHKAITTTITHEDAPTAQAVSDVKISLPPGSAHLASDGTLIVVGTTANDTIVVNPGNLLIRKPIVSVLLNSLPIGTFTLAPSARIIVAGLFGNDDIQVAAGVGFQSVLYGGPNDDRLKGGGGKNIEMGCDGNDQLNAGNLGDLLIGGLGADRIVGGNGNDILVAGIVVDAMGNEDAVYSHLVAILNGGPISAKDDGVIDVLTGSSGTDRFYYHFQGPGVKDTVTDKAEVKVNI